MKSLIKKIECGVRQEDTVPPKLSTMVLEDALKQVNQDNKGIDVNGEYLHRLRFSDNVVVFAEAKKGLTSFIKDSHDAEKNLQYQN